jgi:hypothetical protein
VTQRGAAIAAWSAFGLTAVLAIESVVVGIVDHGTELAAPETGKVTAQASISFSVLIVAFAALGALVASRRPRNPVGWILCLAPVALGLTQVARDWYIHTHFADPGSLPIAAGLMWTANWAWVLGFMPLLTLLLLLFPDGRPPSPRWRWVGWLAAAAIGMIFIGYAFAPGPLEDYPRVDNPLGIEGAASDVLKAFRVLGFPLFMAAAIASGASLAVRFRRSRGVERQQVKWMAAAAAFTVAAWITTAIFDQAFGIDISGLLTVGLLAIPAAAATAILRYRLYDLDLVVNRTLVYGALTATLVGAYLGLVLLFQLILEPLTESSDLAIAGSTLAVAALFGPARNRIQAAVDRRFYRRRYDATRTVEAFSARLRDEVALEAVSGELRSAAQRTLEPAHVSLWLRDAR